MTVRSAAIGLTVAALLAGVWTATLWSQAAEPAADRFTGPLGMEPRPVSTDKGVRYDFDIVYVRAPRRSADGRSKWAEVGDPRTTEPGADLMLLRPDGTEEVLVPVLPRESIADPQVSFDGQSVYYAKLHDAGGHKGADLYRVHVPTRKVTRLTQGEFTPNSRAVPRPGWGVYNLGPCPLPGGRLAFVSDRNGYRATNPGYAPNALALQLFVMDEDGSNVECIGHLNLGSALHPVALRDGRIMFSSLESQGLRSHHLWGIWSIHPDGTNWGPMFSAFEVGNHTADSTHFQTQLGDESVVVQSYYNLNNFGFGTYYKFPVRPPDGASGFGPALTADPRNPKLRHGRYPDGRPKYARFPFSPYGVEALTPFVLKGDWPSEPADLGRKDSPRVGKFTHPAAAPDNHLLTAWSAGSINDPAKHTPAFDSGLYLIKGGKPVDEPGQMLLIKNDPKYHEQWPRALVPYRRIHGVDEPRTLPPTANDGTRSRHLPAGSPFGLVGTSSFYKRESYPYGVVAPGAVTATGPDRDPSGTAIDDTNNWTVQGADAGTYANEDVHAVRLVLLEPTSETGRGRTYYNHARERMRILGEVPLRKFSQNPSETPVEPRDPDGNPDTSFLAKLPADVAWTFQTLDKRGMVLNSSQTWHQLRPGEVRTDCGGCHAHSQKPTAFELTAAAKQDYEPFDLTRRTPLLTTKARDESDRRWDARDETGVRYEAGPTTVEYHRDVRPILVRSCTACHTGTSERPAGNLVLDDDRPVKANNPAGLGFEITVPGTYARLAADAKGQWGHKPLHRHGWAGRLPASASRYVRMMQSRRSLLVWKVFGERLDGKRNDDRPYEAVPGDPTSLRHRGAPVPDTKQNRELAHVGYTGSTMPPPDAVESGKVAPLSAEDRLTLVRWIDLGCPIDLTYDPRDPARAGAGWSFDEQRPTLALTAPRSGPNPPLNSILIGMHDVGTGLREDAFRVVADFPIDGVPAGENLAKRFAARSPGVWEWVLATPLADLKDGTLTVSASDRAGNTTRIERRFSVARPAR